MSHIAHRHAVTPAIGQRGVIMAILFGTIALAVLGFILLAPTPGRVPALPIEGAAVQQADGAADTVAPRQKEDWHGNYNMIRR